MVVHFAKTWGDFYSSLHTNTHIWNENLSKYFETNFSLYWHRIVFSSCEPLYRISSLYPLCNHNQSTFYFVSNHRILHKFTFIDFTTTFYISTPTNHIQSYHKNIQCFKEKSIVATFFNLWLVNLPT